MGHLPVIADVYRCTILWNTANGVAPRNVLHIKQPSGSEADVAEAFSYAYGVAIATNNPWAPMSNTYTAAALDVIKLDGSSATQTEALAATIGGSASGEIIPASAGVMSLHTAQRGPRGRGRQFVGPTTEGSQVNGLLTGGVQVEFAAGWDLFIEALPSAPVPAALVVASYRHADAHEVTSIRADAVCGTQRRRQDQLR